MNKEEEEENNHISVDMAKRNYTIVVFSFRISCNLWSDISTSCNKSTTVKGYFWTIFNLSALCHYFCARGQAQCHFVHFNGLWVRFITELNFRGLVKIYIMYVIYIDVYHSLNIVLGESVNILIISSNLYTLPYRAQVSSMDRV